MNLSIPIISTKQPADCRKRYQSELTKSKTRCKRTRSPCWRHLLMGNWASAAIYAHGGAVRVSPILTSDLTKDRTVTAHSKSNEYFSQKNSIFWSEHNQSTVSKKRKSRSYQNDITWHFIIIGKSAINRVLAVKIIEIIAGRNLSREP